MSQEIVQQTYSSVSYRMIFQILQQATVFVFAVILARLLSPEEFGIIALANLVIHYANNLSDLGFTNALVQNKNIEEIHANSVFTLDFLISISLGIITFFAAESLAAFFNNDKLIAVLKWMSLYYVITTFHYLPVAILRRNLKFKFLSISEYSQMVISSTATITLAYLGFSYWSIVYPTLFFTLIWGFIYMAKANWLPKLKYSHHCMKEIYSFGFWSFIRAQLSMLVSKIDYFVIGRYLPVRDLGIYEKSFEINERSLRGFSTPLNAVFFSSFSRLQDDRDTRTLLFLDSVKILTVLTLPAVFGLICVAGHFVHALLGEAWLDATTPIKLIAIGIFFKIIGGLITTINIATGYYRQQTIIEVVVSFIFIVLCFSLVSLGIVAISFAVVIYGLTGTLLAIIILNRKLQISIFKILKASIYPLLSAITMFLVLIVLEANYFKNTSSILELLILVLVGATIYISLLFLFIKIGKLRFNFSLKDLRLK